MATSHRCTLTLSGWLLLVLHVGPLQAEVRTWRDVTGGFSVEAEFVSHSATSIALKAAGGRRIVIPFRKLSKADRVFVAAQVNGGAAVGGAAVTAVTSLDASIQKVVDVKFEKTPLRDALATLSRACGRTIYLDRTGLSDEGMDVRMPVNYEAGKAPLGVVLEVMLQPSLTWTKRHGVVFVTTKDYGERTLLPQVYRATRPIGDWDTIIENVTSTIFPESWEEVGGPASVGVLPPVHLTITIDSRALKLEGLTTNMQLAMELPPLPLYQALNLMCRQTHHLAWSVQGGKVVVTTQEAAERTLVQVTHSIADLGVDGTNAAELIAAIIAPSEWSELGGAGTIQSKPGALQVKQRFDIQIEVAQLLNDLRAK